MNNYDEVQALLTKEYRLEHQLGQLVYGAPEIRDDKYIYLHRREFGRQTTCYAGEYSDEARPGRTYRAGRNSNG